MSPITTHILDVSLGRPASNVSVQLKILRDGEFQTLTHGITDSDGRIRDWVDAFTIEAGTFQLVFDTATYFPSVGCKDYFYPIVNVCFEIRTPVAHHHVPLLLSPFGYSTYRGS